MAADKLLHFDMASRPHRVAQYHEGIEAARQFDDSLGRIVKVSKDELAKREAAYQQSRANRDRPGPRPRKK
jgi:hypothetical protein